ncbi:fibronectin type III domain-containing protein [Geobacter hydrogenophilus]|uniref:Fibronectin type-III domain-containing protein n=1 Tax=Geobacter hydrogenophilus TaxID=40983 RepID=A0A9W6LD02_9BACT|nr:DUF5666 domain-containing protein [Geobacter hydrogenophilus]MBT0894442.1 fibronectin type III domain-containing protein [Geobacter hydrogenophilus]GLI39402.1 hypothetical protein GHYDROH2_29030 [Geobacter hydrogenophilus]
MRKRLLYQVFAAAFMMVWVMVMAGCGGGGGGSAPVASQGTSKGVITKLGSIFVNGVEYDTTGANIAMENPDDVAGGLKVGMIVTVDGDFSDSTHAKAKNVKFADNLEGPIATLDSAAKTMTVLGQNITFDSSTVFDDFNSAPMPGQMVQVSGFADASGTIKATRIERHLPDWTPATVVELKAAITTMPTATSFTIGGLTVDATGITLPAGTAVGSFVKVEGTLTAFTSTTLKATKVSSFKEGIEVDDTHKGRVEVEGLVQNLTGNTFTVAGTQVNAGNLSLTGVANGVKVEVEGTFANGVLNATKITVETAAPPATVPSAPAPTAAAGSGQVTISWSPVANATSYNIYWSTTTGVTPATGTKIANVNSPYTQTGLTNGTTYFYVMTAVNAVGESAPSTEVSATPAAAATVPAAPTGVTAAAGANQVTVTWPAVTGATSYNLYWSTTTGVTPANGTLIAGVTSPYVQTGLTNGTTYFYVVTAVNAAGESAPSAQVSATPAAAVTVPAAPTGVTATGGANQVTITWPAVTGAASYNLYWSTTTGVTPATGTKIAGVTSPYVQTGLTAATTYFYVLTAQNVAGEGAPSAQVSAMTSAAQPACGSCHAIPPATGQHLFHVNTAGLSCAACHGPGYSSTTVNTATHLNGVINVVSSIGFNATTRTCATPGCHAGGRVW